MALGDITARDSLLRTDVGAGGHWSQANGAYWVLVYNKDGSTDVTVETYLINKWTGDIGSLVDTQDFSELYGGPFFVKYIADGVVAICGRDDSSVGGDGLIITIAVSSIGAISATILGSVTWKVVDDDFEEVNFIFDAIKHPGGNYWAFPFRWARFNGSWTYTWRLAVVSISADGVTLSVTDDDQISTYTAATRTNIKAVDGTIFAVCVDSAKVITVDINTSGVITDAGVDSNDFGFSRQWIEKLSNDWWVMAHLDGSSNGILGSFQISDAGVIDNSFTATSQYDPTSAYNEGTLLNLGGSTTSYVITNYRVSGGSINVSTARCDTDGTVTRLQTLKWDTRNLTSITMVQVAYNMFIVEGSTSDDIYTETIEIAVLAEIDPGFIWSQETTFRFTAEIGGVRIFEGIDTGVDAEAGHAWVEGTYLHYLDENGDERRQQGYKLGATGKETGHIWIEGSNFHYIDVSGDERYLPIEAGPDAFLFDQVVFG